MTQRDHQPVATFVLFAIVAISLVSCLAGCSTVVPVTAQFPEAPKNTPACPQLQKLNDGAKLSDVSTAININYSTYYECAVKVDSWNEWYQIQKRIFEGVAR
jgi:hypothetical protein